MRAPVSSIAMFHERRLVGTLISSAPVRYFMVYERGYFSRREVRISLLRAFSISVDGPL